MKHIYRKLLVVISLLYLAMPIYGYDCQVDDIYYNLDKSNKTASVTEKKSRSTHSSSDEPSYTAEAINIPSNITYAGIKYVVTEIEDFAFFNCSGLTSITIPNSVTSIGVYAFGACSGLTSITIPNSVTEIGSWAFSDCSGLTSITIPNSVTEIGSWAFSDCSGLTSITIPNSVTELGSWAFSGCSELTSITIPNSVTSINSAFDACSGLTSITIPNSVTSIGNYAFRGCSELTSITIPNSVTSIGNYAFSDCSGLTSITIPNSVTSIGDYAFSGCSGLTSITIPNSVTEIGSWAFYGCSELTSITIPNSVTSIGNSAFSGCSGLTSIIIESGNSIYNDGNGNNCIIRTETNTLIRGCNTTVIPNSVTSIGSFAFDACSGLTSITIPNSVTYIGEGAFSGCSGLNSIIVESGNSIFNDGNGNNCIIDTKTNTLIRGCNTTVIPNSVTVIGFWAFSGCSELTSITIPNSVTHIKDYAFLGCNCLLIMESEKPPYAYSHTFAYDYFEYQSSCQAVVPSPAVKAYRNSEGWKNIPINESVHLSSYTQSHIILTTKNLFTNVSALCNGKMYYPKNDTIVISDLQPDSTYTIDISGDYGDYDLSTQIEVRTLAISPMIKILEITNSTISLLGYGAGDANLKEHGFIGYEHHNLETDSREDTLTVRGLYPGTEYEFTYNIVDANGKRYEKTQKVTTKAVTPAISIGQITNTTLTLTGSGLGDAIVTDHGFVGYEGLDSITVEGLSPGSTHDYIYYIITNDGKRYENKKTVTTKEINMYASASIGPASLVIQGGFDNIDATITDSGFKNYQGKSHIELYGLNPGQYYAFTYYIVSKEGGKQTKDFTFGTDNLLMASLTPKVVKEGNVVVAAISNLDDNETNVGFEWRRTDWPDDFASNSASAVIYKGQIEGYIRNVNANYLWRVRPYYVSNTGTYYYGDWIGMDPSNTSYFDPTVHTYEKIEVKGNTAMLKGYAINGTDKVTVQGFKYWKSTTAAVKERDTAPFHAPAVPSDAVTVEASGQVMTASLLDLAYNTTYNYVAFVTTSEGDTFYGEIESFTTEEDPDARFKGDVNEDEKVDISDIVAVINQIAGTATYKYADVNGDNKVDISDIVAIINEIASH